MTVQDFAFSPATTDGRFISGKEGVKHILCTGDGKVEFVAFEKSDSCLC